MPPPIGHDVRRPGAALRADKAPATSDRRELCVIVDPERSEREGHRMLASRIRARHEQAFKAGAP
jgi:hypothetical protein